MNRADDGTAVVEFVFVGLLLMLPLLYLIAAVATVQRSTLAVSQAARDAGRAFATSDSAGEAQRRVSAAVRLALADEHLPNDAAIRYVPAAQPCDKAPIVPNLLPGAQFAVCIIRRVQLPAVPTVLGGHAIRTVGRFVVHVDDYRDPSR